MMIDFLTLVSSQVSIPYTIQYRCWALQGGNECIEGRVQLLIRKASLSFTQEGHLGR